MSGVLVGWMEVGGGAQSMISGIALALFTHPQPRSPHHPKLPTNPFLLRPLCLSCCSGVAMATEKCGNTSVLQREREREKEGRDGKRHRREGNEGRMKKREMKEDAGALWGAHWPLSPH